MDVKTAQASLIGLKLQHKGLRLKSERLAARLSYVDQQLANVSGKIGDLEEYLASQGASAELCKTGRAAPNQGLMDRLYELIVAEGPLSLDDIAERFHMSPAQAFGITNGRQFRRRRDGKFELCD